jgi:F0F1-type ATP synthase membrane subunit c/vacuolar-type H+-ATPase subunit K
MPDIYVLPISTQPEKDIISSLFVISLMAEAIALLQRIISLMH